ncbi:hypothetical protein M3Y96_01214200 [Aphelenchoides besseyi]|nr:hypothetical protein M3Y96_01214200 [Aphelenchoides besseyi]
MVALKVEKDGQENGAMLKIEAEFLKRLETLRYLERSNDKFIYDTFMKSIRDKHIRFTDNFDWKEKVDLRPAEEREIVIANLEVKIQPLSSNDDTTDILSITKKTPIDAEDIDSKPMDESQGQSSTEQTNREFQPTPLRVFNQIPEPSANSTESDKESKAEEKLYPTNAAHHYDPEPFDVSLRTFLFDCSTHYCVHS